MSAALDYLEPVGLAELEEQAPLQRRCERKYVLTLAQLDALVAALAGSHRALDHGGLRAFRYRTTYYDTPDLLTLHAHVQNRRRRFKLRKRRYEDAGRSVVEVKRKSARGQTVKEVAPGGPDDALDPAEAAFLVARVGAAYGQVLDPRLLAPTLTVTCCRSTLVAARRAERVTIDVDLALGAAVRLAPGLAVVESKTAGPSGEADRILQRLGARPVERCSKYCIGVALARPDVRAAPFRVHGRFFEHVAPTPGAAADSAC